MFILWLLFFNLYNLSLKQQTATGIAAEMFIFRCLSDLNNMMNPKRNHTVHFSFVLIPVFLLLMLTGRGQDTIRIPFDQILILDDTTYFGVNDSVAVLDEGSEYELIKNFLVRKPSYYKRKPQKIESVKRLNDKYGRILVGQIYSKMEELPEEFNPSDNYFSIYDKRIVKKIQIERVAVLDGNVFDTTQVALSAVGRFLNSTYSPTKERVIRNNLKFKENEALNPRVFSDNERLLRELSYIEDARISVTPVENSKDSVYVLVVVKDRYPMGLRGKINDYNAFEIEPYSRNFLGLGHNLGAFMEFDGSTDEKFGYGAYYGNDNFWGTFINGEISFNKGLDRDLFEIRLARPFLTTYTRFGGEVIYRNLTEKVMERPYIIDSLYTPDESYSVNLLDVWMGYSFLFSNRVKHPFLNLAGRFHAEDFTKRPEEELEANYPFHDNRLYLASLSFQQVSYIKTSKLLQYGTIEDVPVGINASITGGWHHTAYVDRAYFGARMNYALFIQNAGIFYTLADFGAFRYDSDLA